VTHRLVFFCFCAFFALFSHLQGSVRMQLRDRIDHFVSRGGYWPASLDPLIESAPEFVTAYLAFAGRPIEAGPLPPKIKALIGLALNAAMTHLHAPGIRAHVREALRFGASRRELIEVLQLVSVMAVHACVLGVPVLADLLPDGADAARERNRTDPRRAKLRHDFESGRGYWNPMWDTVLDLDPDYFDAFTQFSSSPWRTGVLEPKVKEFIYIAVAVSATHQFAPGTRIHIENALGYGATAAELLEVMQIASSMGIQSFAETLPVIDEEILRFEGA
jgi:alkylhydroperoxidase/carboxymuconolactone decarboxylase family protein YurZ